MPHVNLRSRPLSGKGWVRGAAACLFIIAVISLSVCGTDSGNPLADSLPAGFTLKGSYYLIQRSATFDGINYDYDSESYTGGVMLIQEEDTLASSVYDLYAYPFSRDYTFDGGMTSMIDSGYVLRSQRAVGLLYRGASDYAFIGRYEEDEDWIVINYTENDSLYTETWKRVKPVTDVPDNGGGVPWVP